MFWFDLLLEVNEEILRLCFWPFHPEKGLDLFAESSSSYCVHATGNSNDDSYKNTFWGTKLNHDKIVNHDPTFEEKFK